MLELARSLGFEERANPHDPDDHATRHETNDGVQHGLEQASEQGAVGRHRRRDRLDQVVHRRYAVHKNAAARHKSRLMRRLNKTSTPASS